MPVTFVRTNALRGAMVLAAFASLAACGGSTEPEVPVKDVTPASITSGVTTPLTGVAGGQVNTALSVKVVNKVGAPVDAALVTFAVVSGGGSLSSQTVRTDANGVATTTWTLGPSVGTQSVTATVGTLAPVTFTATATAGAAKNIAKNSTDPQTATVGAAVAAAPSVKVTDANNNPVSGVTVTFAVTGGGGSVTGATATTDANGIATAGSWRLGTVAGANTLTATAAGITTPITFSATGTVGAVTQVRITNTAPTLNTGQSFAFTTQTLDANNNVVAGAPVSWSSSNTAIATVTSAGVVSALSAGTVTITATSGTGTASQVVNIIGHPSVTVLGTVAMTSSIGGVAIANNTAYVARSTAAALGIVDLPSATLTTSTALGARTGDVAAPTNGGTVAVAVSNPNLVWFTNASGTVLDSIELSAAPVKMAMTANGSRLFVDMNSFNFIIVDVATRQILKTLTIGGTVAAMKVGPGDSLVYVATRLGTVFELSVATNAVKRQFDLGIPITDIAIAPNGRTLFVASGTNTVTVQSLATGGMSGAITFGGLVTSVGVPPDGSALWAAYPGNLAIAPINGTSFDIIQVTPITNLNPAGILFNRLGSLGVLIDVSTNSLVILR